jgi:hypothetical protein
MASLFFIESDFSVERLLADRPLLVAEIMANFKAYDIDGYMMLAGIVGSIIQNGRQHMTYWDNPHGDVYVDAPVDDTVPYTRIDFSLTQAAIDTLPVDLQNQFNQNPVQIWEET